MVEVIVFEVVMYLIVKFDFIGKKIGEEVIFDICDVICFLFEEVKVVIVFFYVFGVSEDFIWY